MTGNARKTLGALCWALAAPLFLIANVVVGLAWHDPSFSWRTNNISDLGNVTCGIWDTSRPRYVCSPWHTPMNVALVLTAVLLIVGLFLAGRFRGRTLLLLGSTGLGLAGAFPADTHENMHFLAALLVFLCGNAGLVVAATGSPPAGPRWVTLGLGVIGVAGAALFTARQGLGLGLGGMERVAVFPLVIWACYSGLRLLRELLPAREDRAAV